MRGPRDLKRLPEAFGQQRAADDYGEHDIQIVGEINHCPRLTRDEILKQAAQLVDDGADLVDVGCDPGETWAGVADTVRSLRDAGYHVSIDSMNTREIEPAVRAGAELVLSVNSSNRSAAPDWGVEVVVVPDEPHCLVGLDDTVAALSHAGVRLRIDPVLEPIGLGFAESLQRYLDVRRQFPNAEMIMGVGNLSELTDVDSAGVNVLLLGFCQELGIRSVLTTQVINWARTSVRECAVARQLVHYAVKHRSLPKNVERRLVMLRDPKPIEMKPDELERLARAVKDHSYRIFAAGGALHIVASGIHLTDSDPFRLFQRLLQSGPERQVPKNISPAHAFYLGYELCKAATALVLAKQYQQDEALEWGMLTVAETSHRAH
jgi:dihydropteroate synthase-like protein